MPTRYLNTEDVAVWFGWFTGKLPLCISISISIRKASSFCIPAWLCIQLAIKIPSKVFFYLSLQSDHTARLTLRASTTPGSIPSVTVPVIFLKAG